MLAILLLLVMPLQFSWAAVAAYCEHEEQTDSQHLGHHEHQAHGVADTQLDDGNPEQKASASSDIDCGHCHGNCASILPLFDVVTAHLSTGHPRPTVDETGGAHAPTRPERPQWLPLA